MCYVYEQGKSSTFYSFLIHYMQEVQGMRPSSLMVRAVWVSICTPLLQDSAQDCSQDASERSLRQSSVLVAIGSKEMSSVFLAVSTPGREENPSMQWHNLECVDQGRLEW